MKATTRITTSASLLVGALLLTGTAIGAPGDILFGTEFNTPGDLEGWTDNNDRLIGFDGEHMSRAAKQDALAYNYTYVNFSGPGVGHVSRYSQTPGLLAAAMEELQEEYAIPHFVVGGHSQGGFLTWVMA